MDWDSDLLSRDRYLVDLSMVSSLAELSEFLPRGSLVVPETLDRLLQSEPSDELAELLTRAAMPPDPTSDEREEFAISGDGLAGITATYGLLAGRGVIDVISDEDVPDADFDGVLDSLGADLEDGPRLTLEDGTELTPRSLVRRHVTTILNYSKRTGTGILAQGRALVSRVGRYIPTLELPDAAHQMVARKQAFAGRFFRTDTARTGKVMVGIVIGGLGVFTAHPALAVGGFLLAVVDP